MDAANDASAESSDADDDGDDDSTGDDEGAAVAAALDVRHVPLSPFLTRSQVHVCSISTVTGLCSHT